MQETPHSGHVLRVFVKGNGDLGALRPRMAGATQAEAIGSYRERPILYRFEQSEGIEAWLAAIVEPTSSAKENLTGVLDFRPDVILCSIEPEVSRIGIPEHKGVEAFKQSVIATDRLIRSRVDANLFWLNGTTVDLDSHVSNYNGLEAEPRSLRIHRLNLALIELSHELGVSIIDVDRVLAEVGLRHLTSELRMDTVRHEIFRVLDDYGYFDDRPIAVQVGQQAQGGS